MRIRHVRQEPVEVGARKKALACFDALAVPDDECIKLLLEEIRRAGLRR